MKNFILFSMKAITPIIFIMTITVLDIFAQSGADTTYLIFDEAYSNSLPRNFRMAGNEFKNSVGAMPDTAGLSLLNISGSAEFNSLNLPLLIKTTGNSKLTVIDLRQETHGFINGMPVSWYGKFDWANLNLSRNEVLALESNKLDSLEELEEVTVLRVLQKNKADDTFLKIKDSTFKVETVMSEQELSEENNAGYYRITATDHRKPVTADVDRFIKLVKKQKPQTWLHFHCHAGDGRTTTFMVMYDMMKNAKKVNVDDIIQRQFLIGGIDLSKDDDFPSWDKQYAIERTVFLRDFYNYCKANNDDFETLYSDWIK